MPHGRDRVHSDPTYLDTDVKPRLRDLDDNDINAVRSCLVVTRRRDSRNPRRDQTILRGVLLSAAYARHNQIQNDILDALYRVCLEDADKIDALLRSGQTIEGGSLRLTNMEITALNGDNAVVAGSLTADMTTVLDGSRRVVETYPTMTRSRNIALKRVEGKWSVQAFLD